jgi:hypothetical protein
MGSCRSLDAVLWLAALAGCGGRTSLDPRSFHGGSSPDASDSGELHGAPSSSDLVPTLRFWEGPENGTSAQGVRCARAP